MIDQLLFFNPAEYNVIEDNPTDSDEWYTPDWAIASVTNALGYIELDPTAEPSNRVNADYYITKGDDCLIDPWSFKDDEWGEHEPHTIYMNPPYSKPHLYLEKMCQYLTEVPQACAITLTKQGTLSNKSTQDFFKYSCKAICLQRGRMDFYNPAKDNSNSCNFDVVWGYWGNTQRLDAFKKVFSKHGLVLTV